MTIYKLTLTEYYKTRILHEDWGSILFEDKTIPVFSYNDCASESSCDEILVFAQDSLEAREVAKDYGEWFTDPALTDCTPINPHEPPGVLLVKLATGSL